MDLGFHEFLIFKLMRDAKRQGKFLSDIVATSWEHIKAASKPICYVQALLRSATDFDALSRYKATIQNEARTRITEKQALAAAIEEIAGKVFYDAAATRRMCIDSEGNTAHMHHRHDPVARVAAGAWQADFIRSLSAGQWIPASPTLDATFCAVEERTIVRGNVVAPGMDPREALMALRAMIRGPRLESASQFAA